MENYTEEIRNNKLIRLERYYLHLKNTKNASIIQTLCGSYNTIGLGELVLHSQDIVTAKKYFFKAGKSQLLYLYLYKGYYPKYIYDDIPSFVATVFYGVMPILLCDNEELLVNFIKPLTRLETEIYTDKEDIAICFALKYLLLNNSENANEALGESYLTAKRLCKYLGLVIAGILKKDLQLIKRGIDGEIKRHKKSNKHSMFYSISQEATAWVKLAKRFGFEPDLNSSFINKELLETSQNIKYEDITEVYKALDIIPFRLSVSE